MTYLIQVTSAAQSDAHKVTEGGQIRKVDDAELDESRVKTFVDRAKLNKFKLMFDNMPVADDLPV